MSEQNKNVGNYSAEVKIFGSLLFNNNVNVVGVLIHYFVAN